MCLVNIPDFLYDVSKIGFTESCKKYGVTRVTLREMCEAIHSIDRNNDISLYSKAQCIVYRYISMMLQYEK